MVLQVHQYNIRILNKPGPQLFITVWLSRHNHEADRDEDVPGMYHTINAIESCRDIPECMKTGEIGIAALDGDHIGMLSENTFHG